MSTDCMLWLQGSPSAGKIPESLVEVYKYNFSTPGALTAAVNYYRCLLSSKKKEGKSVKGDVLEKTKIPTLVIWVQIEKLIKVEAFRNKLMFLMK